MSSEQINQFPTDKDIEEVSRPEGQTVEVVTSTGNAGILPAINDYSGFFAGKMPAFPVEVIEEVLFKFLPNSDFIFCLTKKVIKKNITLMRYIGLE